MKTNTAPIPSPEPNAAGKPTQPTAPVTPRRRLGRFIVGHVTLHHDWRALLPLMAQCVILRAESLYHLEGIEYLALSEAFEEIEMHEQPPTYDVSCRSTEEGSEVFIFTRNEQGMWNANS